MNDNFSNFQVLLTVLLYPGRERIVDVGLWRGEARTSVRACAARDHASAQYPVIGCTLPRAQYRIH